MRMVARMAALRLIISKSGRINPHDLSARIGHIYLRIHPDRAKEFVRFVPLVLWEALPLHVRYPIAIHIR